MANPVVRVSNVSCNQSEKRSALNVGVARAPCFDVVGRAPAELEAWRRMARSNCQPNSFGTGSFVDAGMQEQPSPFYDPVGQHQTSRVFSSRARRLSLRLGEAAQNIDAWFDRARTVGIAQGALALEYRRLGRRL